MFGWVNMRRARAADAEAQKSRLLAEGARSDAEKLVGFLIDDFYDELEPTGRLETMGKLAHMAVSYYDSLPAELVTPRTETYRAHGHRARGLGRRVHAAIWQRPIAVSTRRRKCSNDCTRRIRRTRTR